MKHSVVSLFSGAMGLDLGLARTDRFEVLACIEKERSFCDTIRANHGIGGLNQDVRIYQTDIRNVDPFEVLRDCGLRPGEIDLLIGGPPCQTYSTAGKRRTVQDPRGTLLWEFLRFIDAMQPRFFLMENVRGLLSAAIRHRPLADRPDKGGAPLADDEEPGSVLRLFANDLQRIPAGPYHMDCFEVNAVNYGAPQLRERALLIGNRYNAQVEFPSPTHGPVPFEPRTPDVFDADIVLPWRTLQDALAGLDDAGDVLLDFSPRKKGYLSRVTPGSNWRSMPVPLQKESMGRAWHAKGGRSGWWRRLSFDLPCPTLVTMPNHASTSLCHPTEVRALTLKEYARVQEFPDDWVFCGTTAEQYAQAGNAVPLRLGEVAGKVLLQSFGRLEDRRWKPYLRRLDDYRIIYVQSHVRTRKWFKGGNLFSWSDVGTNEEVRYGPSVIRQRERLIG